MRVTFVRTGDRKDRFYVERDDGTESAWSFPTYGDALPHDLVHFVVERELGLRDGLYAKIARGADLTQVNREAERRGGKHKYAVLGELGDVLWSEVLASAPWSRGDEALDAHLAQISERMGAAPRPVAPAERARVREALAAMTARWRALAPREGLTLTW